MHENKIAGATAPLTNSLKQNIRGWIVVFGGALFYMYQFMIRVAPNVMSDELMTKFSIDASELGALAGQYYIGYALMQLPLGITMDRLGPKAFLCSAAFLCALSSYIFGNTSSSFVAEISRILMGMGSACGLIGTIKLGITWLPKRHVAKVTALTILFGTLGASLAGAPLKLVLNRVGLEHTMEILAVLGAGVGLLILLLVSNKPKVDHHKELPDIYANNHPLHDILTLAKSKQAWLIALYGMLMYVPIATIGDQWGVSFVERAGNTTELVAAQVVPMMFIGAAIGSPIFALFSDFLKSRIKPMIIGSFVTVVTWSAILFIPGLPLGLFFVLFFIAGMAYTAKALTFASICEMMPINMSGVSIAFVNMIVMTTGIIFHPLVGALMEFHWTGTMRHDLPIYSEADYRFALSVIPIVLGVSLILLFFIKETHSERSVVRDYGTIIDTDIL